MVWSWMLLVDLKLWIKKFGGLTFSSSQQMVLFSTLWQSWKPIFFFLRETSHQGKREASCRMGRRSRKAIGVHEQNVKGREFVQNAGDGPGWVEKWKEKNSDYSNGTTPKYLRQLKFAENFKEKIPEKSTREKLFSQNMVFKMVVKHWGRMLWPPQGSDKGGKHDRAPDLAI